MMIQGALITFGTAIVRLSLNRKEERHAHSSQSYWIDFAFYWADTGGGSSSVSWRGPVALQIVFAVVIVCFVLRLPESPRWLVKKGRYEEAAFTFAALLDCHGLLS